MPATTRVSDARGDGELWTPQTEVIELWASNCLDALALLGFTENYFPRFEWAVALDGSIENVLQPSLHAYPQLSAAKKVQQFAQHALRDAAAAHILWLPASTIHLNVARIIPKSRDDEAAINARESTKDRRIEVEGAFSGIPGPRRMRPNGVTANGIQVMVTFTADSWAQWQPVMKTARDKLGLTSHPLDKSPVDRGALVSMTVGIFHGSPGAPTGPIVDALRPWLPGSDTPELRERISQLSLDIDGLSYVLHEHSESETPMRPAEVLALAPFGRTLEQAAERAGIVP